MNTIEYREPKGLKELEAVFKLRFEVYANDQQLHSLVPDSYDRDLSVYDVNGLHFAAFDGQKPVAYMRMTTGSPTHFAPYILELINTAGAPPDSTVAVFPFLKYYPDKTWSEAFIRSLHGQKIGEVGRLVVHPEYRQGSVLAGLITGFIAYCRNDQGVQTGFGSCVRELERYYCRFGFRLAEGSQPFTREGLREAVMVRFDRD